MKPASFAVAVAADVNDVLDAISEPRGEAKILAGGQSLIPLLNYRMARPDVLIDVNRIRSLDYISACPGIVRIGALTRQSTVEQSDVVRRLTPLVAGVEPYVAHLAIRNRSTVGGTLAHGDASSELCTAALALDAVVVARSRRGSREIPIREYFRGPLTTALADDEMLVELSVPAMSPRAGWGFREVARRRGDFAIAAVAAVLECDDDGRICDARLAYASMGPAPIRAPSAERAMIGELAGPEVFRAAAHEAVTELEPGEDLHASQAYRRHVARALTVRALQQAAARERAGEPDHARPSERPVSQMSEG